MQTKFDAIIFDLGGVLIDWNPRYLYRKIFKTEKEIDWFLSTICTPEWNEEQDAGRSFEEGTEILLKQYPDQEDAIRAWYGRWKETIQGSIPQTVDILQTIKQKNGHRLYALTNWSEETFPWALEKFDFLHWFEGIVVSGVEKTRKPFPEFYKILFDRYQIIPNRSIFIDDNLKNVEAGRALGMEVVHFQSPQDLQASLKKLGVL